MRWERVSSRDGQIPTPPGAEQQTLCLTLDADGDGRVEVVIGCRNRGPALVWYRRVAERWTVQVIEPEPIPIEAGGVVCDVDGDGNPDIIAGEDYQGSRVYWWRNPYPRLAPRVPWERHLIKEGGGTQHHDQIWGDFDADGRPELVFWNQGAGKLLRATPPADPRQGPWPVRDLWSGAGEGLAAGDVDGDGRPELLAGGRWFRHEGGGRFASFVIDPEQTHPRIALGDLNGDGRLEVVMAPGDTDGRLSWYERRGDGARPTDWVRHDLLPQPVRHGHSLAVADFSRDGHLDVMCGEMRRWTAGDDHPTARLRVFLGDGRGDFTPTVLSTGLGVHEARVADVDGDGRPDIVAKPYSWDTPRLDLWLNRR
ncbi:MAG: VCBS repeat-containing protein [Chthonomonadales bacterium]|nr:VCBS repeat-containing protein [Chthonomonadales bacterium]